MRSAYRKLLKTTSVNNNGRTDKFMPSCKIFKFLMGSNTKFPVFESAQSEERQMGTTVAAVKRFSYER